MKYSVEWLKNQINESQKIEFLFFWGHTKNSNGIIGKTCFSQWYEASFQVENVVYKTAEHWMMAQKALLFNDLEIMNQIILSNHPKQAKDFGRKVKNYQNEVWNANKFEIVVNGNVHKFSQNPELKKFLLDTKDKVIVEASPVDTIWGIGLSVDSKDIENVDHWRGENLLGFALMEVRDLLK